MNNDPDNSGRRDVLKAIAAGAVAGPLGAVWLDKSEKEKEVNKIREGNEGDPVVANKAAEILLDVLNKDSNLKTIKLDVEYNEEYIDVPRDIVAKFLDASRDVRLAEVKERVFVTSEQRELTRQDLIEILSATTK